jgi:hypothetical protein
MYEVSKHASRAQFANRNKQTVVSGKSKGKKKSTAKTKKSDTKKR